MFKNNHVQDKLNPPNAFGCSVNVTEGSWGKKKEKEEMQWCAQNGLLNLFAPAA